MYIYDKYIYVCTYMIGLWWHLDILHRASIPRENIWNVCVYVCVYVHIYDRSLLTFRHTPQSVNTPGKYLKCVCMCVYMYIYMIGLFWHLDILHRASIPRENVLNVCVYVCIYIHIYHRSLLTFRHTPQSVNTPGKYFKMCVYMCVYIYIYVIGLSWHLDILHRASIPRENVLYVCNTYMYIYIYIYMIGLFWHLDILHRASIPQKNVSKIARFPR